MQHLRKKLDNNGASLVLVIVCMLFVGIISAAVLMMTVGNNKNVAMTKDTSKNFYDTEDFVDDLKIYFQKIANGCATKAYADTLQEIAINGSVDMNAFYAEKFKHYLKQELSSTYLASLTPQTITYGKFMATSDASNPYSEYTSAEFGTDQVRISFNGDFDEGTGTLSDITIDFINGKDYQTVINTSLVFSSAMPSLKWTGTQKDFPYDIDKFIALSGSDIRYGAINGTVNGSIYAKNDINLLMNSTPTVTDTLNLYSKYVICGGILDVSNGGLNFGKLGILYDDVKADVYEVNSSDTSYANGNIWAGNLKIESKATMESTGAEIYLEDDLSLEGENPAFTMNGGQLVGFSSSQKTAGDVSDHEKSSAIIINALNAVVDLSDAAKVMLAGTAFTQVPSIAGQMAELACRYFVEGESVTYKSVQPLYLIPGSWIKGIGRNPMTAEEFATFTASKIETDQLKNLMGLEPSVVLGPNIYKSAGVRYVNGTSSPEYFYVYWDFRNTDMAVDYFNKMSAKSATQSNLTNKLFMMGSSTSVTLPEDVRAKGNLLLYNGSSYSKRAKSWTSDDSTFCLTKSLNYLGLKSTLKKDESAGTDLLDTMFKSGSSLEGFDLASGPQKSYTLYGMTGAGWKDADFKYTGSTVDVSGNSDGRTWKYELVIGSNVSLSPVDGTKYVVISTGNVSINSAPFNGIIIAKGDVYLNASGQYNCFGNYKRKKTNLSDGTVDSEVYMSEFRALLEVVWDNDSEVIETTDEEGNVIDTKVNGNTLLRKIFGVASGSGSSGSSILSDDLVWIDTANVKIN